MSVWFVYACQHACLELVSGFLHVLFPCQLTIQTKELGSLCLVCLPVSLSVCLCMSACDSNYRTDKCVSVCQCFLCVCPSLCLPVIQTKELVNLPGLSARLFL